MEIKQQIRTGKLIVELELKIRTLEIENRKLKRLNLYFKNNSIHINEQIIKCQKILKSLCMSE